jgi:hypothetical protein
MMSDLDSEDVRVVSLIWHIVAGRVGTSTRLGQRPNMGGR